MSHHIQLHEKWYPNSIKQKYQFILVRCNVRKYNLLYKSFIGRKNYEKLSFSFNPNIRVYIPLESFNLFLRVFLCLKVILTMEHYVRLLTIFIWKFAIFWSWQTCPVKFETSCPTVIFSLAVGSRPSSLRYLCCWLAHVFGKRTPFKII